MWVSNRFKEAWDNCFFIAEFRCFPISWACPRSTAASASCLLILCTYTTGQKGLRSRNKLNSGGGRDKLRQVASSWRKCRVSVQKCLELSKADLSTFHLTWWRVWRKRGINNGISWFRNSRRGCGFSENLCFLIFKLIVYHMFKFYRVGLTSDQWAMSEIQKQYFSIMYERKGR